MDREPQPGQLVEHAGAQDVIRAAPIPADQPSVDPVPCDPCMPLIRTRRRPLGKRFETRRVERLLTLAEHLSPADRALVEAVYRSGMSVAAIARTSEGGPSARVLRCRLRRLVKRLLDRRAEGVARAIRFELGWSTQRRDIARCRYFEFATMREIARRFGLSIHQARRKVCEIDAIASEVAP